MTRPDHPRPEVVALDAALDGAMATAGLRVMPSHYTHHVLTRLHEAGFAIVDMDALTERVARNMFSDPERQALYRAKARRLIEGGRT